MTRNNSLKVLRIGSGRPAVNRWLAQGENAVLFGGTAQSGADASGFTMSPSVLHEIGTLKLESASPGAAEKLEQTPAGLLNIPTWDIAPGSTDIMWVVEVFGGATSTLAHRRPGQPVVFAGLPQDGISHSAPRFERVLGGAVPAWITTTDQVTGRMWRVPASGAFTPEPVGQGLRSLLLREPTPKSKGGILLSTKYAPGGLSPFGDKAGQLQVAQSTPVTGSKGHTAVLGVENLQVYDFDANFTPSLDLKVLAATLHGLHLLGGTPDGLEIIQTITTEAVLHPALFSNSDGDYVAYNRIGKDRLTETELVHRAV